MTETRSVFAIRCTFASGRNVLRTRDGRVITYETRSEAKDEAKMLGRAYPDNTFAVEKYDARR